MKVEAKLLLGLGLFFGLMCAVYWNWSLENAGGVMMFAGMLLGFLPGSYYYWWSRRMKPRPEDDPNATQADGAGVVGSFPGTSIWPFTLGMGAFSCVLALVFGIWLLVPGLGLVIWAMFGGTSEGRRGGHV
ncbi:MAG: cytochrome c oxidase subunit 4 [Acidobacteriota bacterium]|nr:cytochrome c oxidase subunit 4 [Acidobacteriota bacterium]MDE3108199.1 cytochrome c oxidase subunit 4 [Acidobacteriota bacterium]